VTAIALQKHQWTLAAAPAEVAQPRLRPIAFIDIETTGLDLQRDSIIEVAAMRVDPISLDVESWFATRIAPAANAVVDPEAARLNGYRAEEWVDAPPIQEVLPQLAGFLEGCLIAGHNPAFDWAFLSAAFRRLGLRRPDVGHHLLDTATLAWPLFRLGFLRSLTLRELCEHYGVSNVGEHHALCDAVRTYQVFLRLLHAGAGNVEVVTGGGLQ
jgi:DNA polymerase-3 subunit epsilon